MRTRASFIAVLALFIAVPVVADDKKTETELKAMVGSWKVEKAELGGNDLTEQFKGLKFEVREGGKYTVQIGEVKDEGAFTIDPSKTPKEVDIKSSDGPNKGKTIKAIYKLDGDTFTVCYELNPDKKRPEKFESKDKTAVLLVTYKREKK